MDSIGIRERDVDLGGDVMDGALMDSIGIR